MMNDVKFMKIIMNKSNIQRSMHKYASIYNRDPKRLLSIKENVNRTHACGNIKFNYFQLQCPSCAHSIKVPLTCKSRLCNKCGKIYSEKWANKLANSLLNVTHKHIIFSLPKNLRELIFSNRQILSKLTVSINDILSSVVNGNTKKIGRKKTL